MAFFNKSSVGQVTGDVMMTGADMLPAGDKDSAIRLAWNVGADFIPVKHPVVHPSGHVPGSPQHPTAFTVWNENVDPPALLNPAVSAGFACTPYMQTIESIEQLFPNSCTGMLMIEHGKVLMMTIHLTGAVDLGGGDVIKPHLTIVDSQDGSRSTQVHASVGRVACENQFSYASRLFSQRHSKNHSLILAGWFNYVARAKEDWDDYVRRCYAMKNIRFAHFQEAFRMLMRIMPEPQRSEKQSEQGYRSRMTRWNKAVDAIWHRYKVEAELFGHSAWVLVQAIQYYEYHVKTKNDPVKQMSVVTDPDKKQKLTLRAEELVLA